MRNANRIQAELDALRSELAGSFPLCSVFSFAVPPLVAHETHITIKPPCTFAHIDGSKTHFVWESTLLPERDTSERLIEIHETKGGHVVSCESAITRPVDFRL